MFTGLGTAKATNPGEPERITESTLTLKGIEYYGDPESKNTAETDGPECLGFGLEAMVDFATNGCHYTFHAGTIVNPGTSEGTVDLVCSKNEGVLIDIGNGLCTVKVPAQNGINGITYHTVETDGIEEITVEAHSNNLSYRDGGAGGNETLQNNGKYRGKATVKAFEDENDVDGEQVNATITST